MDVGALNLSEAAAPVENGDICPLVILAHDGMAPIPNAKTAKELGVVIGVLPGLGATTGAALLLPFTLTMAPVHAIAVLATIYVSATFAGSITAMLINTPGTSAAAATTFDGYPLCPAGRALGVAVVSSTVGGVFSVIVLCVAPLAARVAYEFRPPEYVALTLFGFSMLASISAGGAVRNLIGGVFGVWLATIGAERGDRHRAVHVRQLRALRGAFLRAGVHRSVRDVRALRPVEAREQGHRHRRDEGGEAAHPGRLQAHLEGHSCSRCP